ncbi:MAG TPA: lytic murein transglycosylase [Beijerinckiaceae bacterium]|nr:lytic murein transglycosylase [Beijerinckiaceae bacterium]
MPSLTRALRSLVMAVVLLAGPAALPARADFKAFVAGLWPEAQAAGVSRATFDAAFAGVTLDASVVAQTKRQSEFIRPIWDYVGSAVSTSRISRGRAMAEQWSETVAAVERRYGVDRRVFLGIWGMETSYGSFFGGHSVIRALASLAYVRYRDDFFRKELIVALQILEEGHVEKADMKGSWAGAMGHTQFMPSSFMKHAVDATGDGHKDIWGSVPDALASTANYLKQHGWQSGLPWGFEVILPEGLDFKQALGRKSFSGFAALGIKRADEEAMPSRGEANLFLPAGIKGPKFLITDNFKVIKAYNSSDAYAMGVGLLGDTIYGGEGLTGRWPKADKRITKAEGVAIQKLLNQRGLYNGKYDGRFGEQSREAVTRYQLSVGMVPDGYATPALLARLKGSR